MRKWTKIATALILCGGLLFAGVMIELDWDFRKLSTDQFETNSYELFEPYYNVRIVTDTAHVSILPAEDRVTAVDCYELTSAKHTVSIQDGTLTVEVQDTRQWYEHIGFHFESATVKVYLPSGVYSDLTIECNTGDVEIAPDFRFNKIAIDLDTGDATNRASAKESITICTDTGDVRLDGCDATTLKIETDTGDVHLDGCDAATLRIETDTGDVTGTLLSDKVFIAHASTGDVSVPHTNTGGRCEITTDTGDIDVSIQK